jgi:exopolyphosphatase/guanosine-5'-triphosphate,3'-diphosphate pyrophosphatase
LRLAAIDIGSNAARLLISDVIAGPQGQPEFIKIALIRVPLRLGFDVFETGEISAAKTEKLSKPSGLINYYLTFMKSNT